MTIFTRNQPDSAVILPMASGCNMKISAITRSLAVILAGRMVLAFNTDFIAFVA